MIHLGDITKMTAENTPPVNCITFGSPCFPAGTLVLTDKGYVEIEKVKIGDRCFTHAGNWETVTAVGKKNAPTVKLKGTHYGLVSTYNHPFYSAEQESKWNGNGYDRVLSRVGEWTYASKMCGKRWAVPNNISGIKIPSIEKESKRQNDPPKITPQLMYFVGRWLADGWVRDGQRSNRPKGQMYGQIYICANAKKIEKLEKSAKSIFNKNVKINRIHERTVDKIRINNQALCKWIKNNFGTMADGKKLPAWAFCMPKEYRQSLVNGYFDGDGYCVKDEIWKSTTVSEKLAHGIRLLCETLGYSCSVYYYDVPSTTVMEGRTVSQKPQYQIRVSKTQGTNSIKQNGFNWYKCTSVESYCENQTVYNITVNKDHSYIVEGFVVHNCQDLSIAGKRAGLEGERSGLFMEAVRIIKEMRDQSGGLYPTFAVWENVPGAFSSNRGEDFRTVLEELARIKDPEVSIPRPENGKWAKAGFICGDGWNLAWRTFDAQFWGVPQRRRRIAVVVDFRGQRAGEILFERAGLSRDFEPSIPAWEGIARDPSHGAVGYDRMVEGKEPLTYPGVGITSKQNASNPQPGCPCHTLNTDSRNYVCMLQTNGIEYDEKKGHALRTDRDLTAMPTLLCRSHGQENAETLEDLCPTLNCNHEQPIVFESHSQDERYTQQGDTSPACTAQMGTGGNNMPLVAEKYARDIAHALRAKANCSFREDSDTIIAEKRLRWIVRRLTPTECERLQGFPDGWTDIGEWYDSNGKKRKPADSPRYKALGNSIALPQWWWITCKMAPYLPKRATLGSLFDGIGGFPLVWETYHGKGTAVWASEIEEFPIAVTKEHFKNEH